MENLEIKVSRKTRMVELPKQFISVEGENLQSKLVFSFIDGFVNGQARLEYKIKGEKKYIILDKENETYTLPVKNVLTIEGQIDMQLVITEGTSEENIPVFKSNMFYLFCNSSINAVGEAPEGYELWIEKANAKLNEVDNVDIDIKSDDENVYVEITKRDGTKKDAVVSGGGTGGTTDYKALINKPKINNVVLDENKTLDDLGIQPKGNYLTDIPAEYLTNSQLEEKNFATKEYVENEIATFDFIKIVTTLPATGLSNRTYFVAKTETNDNDLYDEYQWINNKWEFLGNKKIEVDLTDYVKKNDVASQTNFGVIKVWTSTNEDGEIGLNISTEV